MRIAINVLLFAVVAVMTALVLDALLWLFYQGGPLAGQEKPMWIVHAIVHAAIFITALLGAGIGYVACRTRRVTRVHAALAGLVFALLGPVAGILAMAAWRPVGGAAVLLLVAVTFTAGGARLFAARVESAV